MLPSSERRPWSLIVVVAAAMLACWLATRRWDAVAICGIACLSSAIVTALHHRPREPDDPFVGAESDAPVAVAESRVTQNVTLPFRAGDEAAVAAGVLPTAAGQLAAVIDSLPESAIIVRAGRIEHSNAPARALLGDHIDGADVRLAIRHPAAVGLLGAERRPEVATVELVGLGAPGRSWQLRVAPVDADRLLALFTDNSAVRAAERMRADFVANASHELRTPLASITGFIETLADPVAGADAETRTRFLAIMDREARRMLRLVEDLISLSRIEGDRFRAPEDAVPIGQLAEEVVAVLRDGPAPRSGDIAPVEGAALPARVRGDRAQLSQLLHNLIDNALKYGAAGTPVRISIRLAPGGMVQLMVSDEGEGIAPEHLPRLTERFYRADSGRSRSLGGTGLGLAIVKHIIERHRGHLRIDSAPGRGTRVEVLLPVAPERP